MQIDRLCDAIRATTCPTCVGRTPSFPICPPIPAKRVGQRDCGMCVSLQLWYNRRHTRLVRPSRYRPLITSSTARRHALFLTPWRTQRIGAARHRGHKAQRHRLHRKRVCQSHCREKAQRTSSSTRTSASTASAVPGQLCDTGKGIFVLVKTSNPSGGGSGPERGRHQTL